MKALLSGGKSGKVNVTLPATVDGEHGGIKFSAGVHEFKTVDEAFAFGSAFETASEAVAGRKSELTCKLTYRGELQAIGPDGFPVFTVAMDKLKWIETHLPVISATARMHADKIAADYTKRAKALPKGSKEISENKVTLTLASVAAPAAS
jgi:hypothetical protein